MQNKIATGISFPVELIKQIDRDRGDVSRSKYLVKFLEKKYKPKEQVQKKQDESQRQLQAHSAEPQDPVCSSTQGEERLNGAHIYNAVAIYKTIEMLLLSV